MRREKFVKKVCVNENVGPDSRGMPLGRWKDRVKEYMCERGAARGRGQEQARWECLDRGSWSLLLWLLPCGMFLEGVRGQSC